MLAGTAVGLICDLLCLALAVPWLAAQRINLTPLGHGNMPVLVAVPVAAALFAAAGTGLGALSTAQLPTATGLLIFLYLVEPALSRVHGWTNYLPGLAADALTQASQSGVVLLRPWLGGIVFAGWTIAVVGGGALRTLNRDLDK